MEQVLVYWRQDGLLERIANTMNPYDKWSLAQFGKERPSPPYALAKHLELFNAGSHAGEPSAFLFMLGHYCMLTQIELGHVGLVDDDALNNVIAAATLVAFSIITPFSKPDYHRIGEVLMTDEYRDNSVGPYLVYLMSAVVQSDAAWKALRPVAIRAIVQMAEFLDVDLSSGRLDRRKLSAVLPECLKSYYRIRAAMKPRGSRDFTDGQ